MTSSRRHPTPTVLGVCLRDQDLGLAVVRGHELLELRHVGHLNAARRRCAVARAVAKVRGDYGALVVIVDRPVSGLRGEAAVRMPFRHAKEALCGNERALNAVLVDTLLRREHRLARLVRPTVGSRGRLSVAPWRLSSVLALALVRAAEARGLIPF